MPSYREVLINFPFQCPFCKKWIWRPEYLLKGKNCFRCGSKNVKHETISLMGKRGMLSTKGFIFDLYLCEDCNYAELYYRPPKSRKTLDKKK